MATFRYRPGSEVLAKGMECTILKNINLEEFLVRFKKSDKTEVVARGDLEPLSMTEAALPYRDAIDQKDIDEAERRFSIIQPLIGLKVIGREAVEAAAKKIDCTAATIYRWIADYETHGLISALAPRRKKSQSNQKRLPPEVEAVVENRIEKDFLSRQRISKKELHRRIALDCKKLDLKSPGYATICRRVDAIDEFEKKKKRRGPKQAKDSYGAAPGIYDDARGPLDIVQIDHTQLNIIVVDSELRLPIGRPWITLAIDVFSRMVTGLYLSMDPPSANSVGLCLANGILEKEEYLESLKIEGCWPVWGLMNTLHCDNAKEFRGSMLRDFCSEWGINLQWRAVGRPEWGAHIERLNGTLKRFLDGLSGTTFQGPQDRREYDSEGRAIFTLDELEKVLITYLVKVYHEETHKTLKRSPLAAWEDGITGENGSGLPDPIEDPERLRLDLLPLTERTIQKDGIHWDNITYFQSCLNPWIKAKSDGKRRKFKIRRDPRDISRLYFLDPKLGQYFTIPYRNTGRPVISLSELRAVQKHLDRQGRKRRNEEIIFHAYEEIKRLEQNAKKTTKKVRKSKEQKRRNKSDLDRTKKPEKQKNSEPRLVKPVRRPPGHADPPPEEEYFDLTEDDMKPNYEKW